MIITINDNIIVNENKIMTADKNFVKKTEILFHPVRIRVLQTLATRNLTPLQLAEELVNVPQATLYRHLNKMVQAEILQVVEERPVRGTVEKVYGLNRQALQTGSRNLLQASREELMELFTNFMLAQVREFGGYLQRDSINLIEDKVSFRQASFYMTDAEFMEFAGEIGQAFLKRMSNKPGPGRKPLLWTTIIIPGPEESPVPPDNAAEPEGGPEKGIIKD